MYLMCVTQAPTNSTSPEGCESVLGVPCVTNTGTTGILSIYGAATGRRSVACGAVAWREVMSNEQPVPPATEQPSFTPGPWSVRENESYVRKGRCIPKVFADNGDHIYFEVATLYGGGFRNHEEARATARMIAAAPDLYAACKAAWNDPSTSREIAVMLEAALAKAVAQ